MAKLTTDERLEAFKELPLIDPKSVVEGKLVIAGV